MENLSVEKSDDIFKIIDLEQGSPQWREFRKGKIGASQVGAIMGLNPYCTKLQAWEDILLGKEKEDNENMARGRRLEPIAREWFNVQHGNDQFSPIVAQSKKHPDLIASLDGWNGKEVLEIKCPRKFSEVIVESYYAQMQHQLFITGANLCWYLEYVDGVGIVSKVHRNALFIEKMVQQELAFLKSITDFRPPLPSEKDWVIEQDDAKISKSYRFREVTNLIIEMEIERERLRAELIEDCDHPRIKCGEINIQKVITQGRIDYEQIVKDHNITDIEKYRRSSKTSWRITVD